MPTKASRLSRMRASLFLLVVTTISNVQSETDTVIPCGYANPSNRVWNGRITSNDDFPWTALLFYGDGDSSAPRCGGVLISQLFVVTSARCLIGDTNLTFVRLGEYELNANPDCMAYDDGDMMCYKSQVDIKPKRIIIHPKFKSNTASQQHDIALVELEQPVNFTYFILPICLPDQPFEISTERNFTAAGWGLTDHFREQGYPNIVSPIKLKHELQLFDRKACQDVYRSQISLGSDQFCVTIAGEPSKDTCFGFRGSPLMIFMETQEYSYWVLVGLVSYELQKCSSKGKPAIYTNVKQHVDWIQQNLEGVTGD